MSYNINIPVNAPYQSTVNWVPPPPNYNLQGWSGIFQILIGTTVVSSVGTPPASGLELGATSISISFTPYLIGLSPNNYNYHLILYDPLLNPYTILSGNLFISGTSNNFSIPDATLPTSSVATLQGISVAQMSAEQATILGGTIDNTVLGSSTPNMGSFTDLLFGNEFASTVTNAPVSGSNVTVPNGFTNLILTGFTPVNPLTINLPEPTFNGQRLYLVNDMVVGGLNIVPQGTNISVINAPSSLAAGQFTFFVFYENNWRATSLSSVYNGAITLTALNASLATAPINQEPAGGGVFLIGGGSGPYSVMWSPTI